MSQFDRVTRCVLNGIHLAVLSSIRPGSSSCHPTKSSHTPCTQCIAVIGGGDAPPVCSRTVGLAFKPPPSRSALLRHCPLDQPPAWCDACVPSPCVSACDARSHSVKEAAAMSERRERVGARSARHARHSGRVGAIAVLGVIGTLLLAVAATGAVSAPSANTKAVVIGTSQGLPNIHPEKAATLWQQYMRPLMYSALTRYSPSGGLEVQPDLAATWRASRDLKTYTF